MVTLTDLRDFLDAHLQPGLYSDVAQNGLQVQGRAKLSKVALGVSVSLELFERSIDYGAEAIITHHGLFWGKPAPVVGPLAARLGALLRHDVSLLAYHLPLDAHPEDGNNARLAAALGLESVEPWGDYHGRAIGCIGSPRPGTSMASLVESVGSACVCDPVVVGAKVSEVRRVAVCSGSGGSLVPDAIESGADVLVTGEPGEPAQELARESRMAVVGAGHYNTERFGVEAIGERLEAELGLETRFIDVPNPI